MVKLDFKYILIGVLVLIILMLLKCEEDVKTTTSTEVNIEQIVDSIKRSIKKEVKTVYIDTGSTKKIIEYLPGDVIIKDSLIYVNDSTKTELVKAQKSNFVLESNKATANIDIISEGKIYDVSGVIKFPEVTKTIKETKIKTANQLFIGLENPINRLAPELSVDFVNRNKWKIKAGAGYNDITQKIDYKIGFAIGLFNR